MEWTTLPSFVKAESVKMAILAVPASHAQEVANVLVEAGVQAILNFSPTVLQVPENVTVNSVDLALGVGKFELFHSLIWTATVGGSRSGWLPHP